MANNDNTRKQQGGDIDRQRQNQGGQSGHIPNRPGQGQPGLGNQDRDKMGQQPGQKRDPSKGVDDRDDDDRITQRHPQPGGGKPVKP